jgi:hypothetical protein
VKIIKKIVQKPKDLESAREVWLSWQRVINAGLRSIDPRYEIRNLIRRPDGAIEFEASVKFNPKHAKKVQKLLALLKDPDLEFTQAKFYIPKELQKRLKRRAVDLGVPTSSLMSAILAENT